MPIDSSPGVVLTLPRDKIRDRWTTSYKLRVPAADVGPGTQPYVDGSVAADAIMVVYSDAVTIGRGTTLRTSSGPWLQIIGEDEGIYKRPAVGASGFLTVTTSSGGANILAGTIVTDDISQLRYQVTETALYSTTTPVPVQGVDTGPATNQPAGAAMTFQAPPPGLSAEATVRADSDGNGLIGGRDADDDATYRQLISYERANPAAAGNDADYQFLVRETPGVSVQQCFTYPAILGPGTMGYCFALNPSSPGAERAPTTPQAASSLAYITGILPADDGIFACQLLNSPVNVAFLVVWGVGSTSWVDPLPWPPYVAGDQVKVSGTPTPSFDSFRLTTGTTTVAPQAGQNLGFFDPVSKTFKLIRIGTVSTVISGKAWDIVPDRSFGASDPTFFPTQGLAASPWSASLNAVVPAVVSYFDGLGPGEQNASLPDPGFRQRRQPQSPQFFPSLIDARVVIPIYSLGNVIETVTPVAPSLPFQTPVGVPGVLSYLSTLGDMSVYPPP